MIKCCLLAILSLFFTRTLLAMEDHPFSAAKENNFLISLRAKEIVDIDYLSDAIPDNLKEKILPLKGKKYSPKSLRQIALWFHETSGDARLEFAVAEMAQGLVLQVSLAQRTHIKQVIVEGAQKMPLASILALLDVRDGSEIDVLAIEGAAQKLVNFYAAQGFRGTKVRSELDANKNLKFLIDEGEPSLLKEIAISPLQSVGDKKLQRILEQDLRTTLDLEENEVLTQEKLSAAQLNLRNWLRSHDFLMAKDPAFTLSTSAPGQLGLKVDIDYGARIRFGFRGNERFSHRELQAQISEIKEVNVGVDYIESVRRRVQDLYREVGLINVKIDTLVREDAQRGVKYVSLIIKEGKRVEISQINIDGIFSLTQEEARAIFSSYSPRIVQRNFFQEQGIQRAGELLAEYLQSKGFLSAKLEFTRFDFSEDRKKVKVFLLFNEGVQTRIREIKLGGFNNLKEEEVRETLAIKESEPFNVFAFEKGLVKLKDRYQDLGHLNMTFVNEADPDFVLYSRDQTEVSLNINAEEGPPIRLGEVIVRGNSQTHTRVVTREMPVISGDILTRPILKEVEDNIRRLNLFASVIVRPIEHPGAEDIRDLLILVEETIPGAVEFAPGYRNDLGMRAAIGVSYQNIGGWHRGASARAVVNRRVRDYRFPEYNISFGFREPYFANWPVTFTSNLNFLRRQFEKFDANVSKITSGFSRDITKNITGLLDYSYERSSISNYKPPYEADDEGTNFIGALIPGVAYDSRSDKFNPREGVYSLTRFEWAIRQFGTERDIGYYKITSSNSSYFTLWDNLVFAFAMNFGFERSTLAGKEIPVLKLFRLGGIGSVRGYKDDGIEIESTKNIKGTLTTVNYRSEMRFPIYGDFGGALFFDAGNLFVDDMSLVRFGLLRSSAGMGLRYNTPVGPVLLDLAKKLERKEVQGDTRVSDTDRYRVHFAIGAF